MIQKIIFLLVTAFAVSSCQFTETMVLQEDGSGRMELSVDLSEIMAMSGDLSQDSTLVKSDTIIAFKDILEERKDSIAQLSEKEQARLKAMENYHVHMVSDPENKKFVMDVFTEFSHVSEANELMKGFDFVGDYMPGSGKGNGEKQENAEENEVIGVVFEYRPGHFKRDAFIRDPEKHQREMDSLQKAESFLSGITYKLKYTFPKKIKATNVQDATFSLDGKTLELQRNFLEYFKNPDVMDVEVELEN